MSSDNVVQMRVTPKTLTRQYKRQTYTVTFIPKTKKWKWSVTVVTSSTYSEEADTDVKAIRAAEKFIEQHVKGI